MCPLIDETPEPAGTQSVDEGAAALRRIARQSVRQAQGRVERMVALVDRHGRANLAAALNANDPGDGAELLAVFGDLVAIAERDPNYTAPALPS